MHPIATLKGFIKGELIRFKNNSSNIFYYRQTKERFYKILLTRGYQRSFIDPIFKKNTFSTEYQQTPCTILPIVIPYSLHSEIPRIKNELHIVTSNPFCIRRYIPNSKVILAFSKSPNICQILTSTKLTKGQSEEIKSINDLLYPDSECTEFRNNFAHTAKKLKTGP